MGLSSEYCPENPLCRVPACFCWVFIQEIVRPPSETDTLVAGAAVSECLTTRSGVTTVGEFCDLRTVSVALWTILSRRGRHWGSAVSFNPMFYPMPVEQNTA